jgi:hypothetical protein
MQEVTVLCYHASTRNSYSRKFLYASPTGFDGFCNTSLDTWNIPYQSVAEAA